MNEIGVTGRNNMLGLSYGEHFIIWGIRRMIAGKGPDGLLLDECMGAFNEDGEAGLGVLNVFLRLLGRSARKTLEVGSPETLFVTWDERGILTLLAAAQADGAAGKSVLFQAHLRWLSKLQHRPELAQAALSLGRLLEAHGHRFSLEISAAPCRDDGAANGMRTGTRAWHDRRIYS